MIMRFYLFPYHNFSVVNALCGSSARASARFQMLVVSICIVVQLSIMLHGGADGRFRILDPIAIAESD